MSPSSARILVGSFPFAGHATPLVPIVRELVERGHEVSWYTGSRFRAAVEATGARWLPVGAAPDIDEHNLDACFPARRGLVGLAALKFDLRHVFIETGLGHVRDYQSLLPRLRPDILLADATFSAARLVHEMGGPPWAAYNTGPLTLGSRDTAPFGVGFPPSRSPLGRLRNRALRCAVAGILFRDVLAHTNRVRARLGLPPTRRFLMDEMLSPYLHLQGTVRSFEYPRSDLPPQVHFIGPVLPPPPADFSPPAWWGELGAGRPVVHVTQGTIATDAGQLLAPALRALAGEDVLVVATTGGKPLDGLGRIAIPANARIERFIPHAKLLPSVDVMVTNGGYNGVQIALAHGVPLVAAGTTEDKPEACARIAWAGVGVSLRTATPKPEQIRAAVLSVLRDPTYRRNAQRLAEEFARHDAPTEAADLIERLIDTRAPVVASGWARGRALPSQGDT